MNLAATLVKRVESRCPVALAVVLVGDGPAVDACIRNISPRGVMLVASAQLGRGEMVELYRGAQTLVGTVKWQRGGRIGLRLAERIDVAAFLSGAEHFAAPARTVTTPTASAQEFGAHLYGWVLAHFQYLVFGLLAIAAAIGAAGLVSHVLAPLDDLSHRLPG